MDGALLIDKPAGLTSAQVVARMKRRFGVKTIGHAGTLDPLATGLLIVLCGRATKLQSLLLSASKSYTGNFKFGIQTDTDDISGCPIRKEPFQLFANPCAAEGHLKLVQEAFLGEKLQVPPQFSAIKQKGVKSYQFARKGLHVEHAARQVCIFDLQLKFVDTETCWYFVKCSKGTYVRSLARDIGLFLGSCACVESIRRVQSGNFSIEQAYALEEVEEKGLEQCITKCADLVNKLPLLRFTASECRALRYGDQSPLLGCLGEAATDSDSLFAMFDHNEIFIGLAEKDAEKQGLKIRCMF